METKSDRSTNNSTIVKTYRSTLNSYFATSTLIIAITLSAMTVDTLAPYRDALSATLGLAENQLWILLAPLSLSVLVALFLRLRKNLCQPIEAFTEQCATGSVCTASNHPLPREIRIVRAYIRQSQDRAQERSAQVSRMEEELFTTRKANDRYIRKIEELEDLVASYGRIRNELNYDLSLLRQENRNLDAQLKALQMEVASQLPRKNESSSIYLNGY